MSRPFVMRMPLPCLGRRPSVPRPHRQAGLSLVEMTVMLASLAALVTVIGSITADQFGKSRALDSDALLRMADAQLRQHVAANGRLPCPDADADGHADGDTDGSCNGAQKGYLPYKTLGMTDRNYVYGEVPLLYGVFNHAGLSFTSRSQTWFPTYQDKANEAVQVSNPRGIFDFCHTLHQLAGQGAVSADGLGVSDGSTTYNAVYALAVAGQGDRDAQPPGWTGGPSINAQYDGRNALSPNLFEMPQARLSPGYDDQTRYRSALDLIDYYRCKAMNGSVDLLVEAVTVQRETEDFADRNTKAAKRGLVINAIGIGLSTWQLLQTFAAISEAGEEITLASTALATVSAACPIPPWATCALIPVYATALANATTGLALAIASSVTAGAALGLQITATTLYDDLKARTTQVPDEPDTTAASVPAARLAELRAGYVDSKEKALAAFEQLSAAPTDAEVSAARTDLDDKLSAINGHIDAITDDSLKAALSRNLNGHSGTCTPGGVETCAGYAERQVPLLDADGKLVTNADGTLQMTTIHTKDLTSAPYSPGLVPALGSYYQALAQAGAKQPPMSVPQGADQATIDAINASNAALSAAPTVEPAQALGSANGVIAAYGSLLGATADFDQKNLAYQAALITHGAGSAQVLAAQSARETARQALAAALGDPGWDTTTTTSLCGGGISTGCGWMTGAAASAGSDTTLGTTGSAAADAFLSANTAYETMLGYQKLKDAADSAANAAWSDRNSFKTALCSVATPPLQFVGSMSIADADPASWDQNENLLATDGSGAPAPVGLNCAGGEPIDTSVSKAEARAAEQARYCSSGGPHYDAFLCTLYSKGRAARSTIRNAEEITNTLIRKGIAK